MRHIRKRTIGKVDIYFLSGESIAIVEERVSKHGDLSSYMLMQSWHERNKAPFKRFKRQLERSNYLTAMDTQLLAARYNVQITCVSREIIPLEYRQAPTLETLALPEVAHAAV